LLEEIFKVISKYFQFTAYYCRTYNAIQLRTALLFTSLDFVSIENSGDASELFGTVKRGHQIREFFYYYFSAYV
jgi:hypothetical protein